MMAFIDTIQQDADFPAPVRAAEAIMPETPEPAARIRRPVPRPTFRPRITLSEPQPKVRKAADVRIGAAILLVVAVISAAAGVYCALAMGGVI